LEKAIKFYEKFLKFDNAAEKINPEKIAKIKILEDKILKTKNSARLAELKKILAEKNLEK